MDERGSEADNLVPGGSKVPRACDPCRARKIRCDRGTPCSNCRASKLACQTTTASQKPPRQRVNISDEYERKIDRIEDRLGGIESVLSRLASRLGSLDLDSKGNKSSSPSDYVSSSKSTSQEPEEAPGATTFEGDTTLSTQSRFAQDLVEKAVISTPSMQQNAEVKAALSSLQAIVSRQTVAGDGETNLFGQKRPHEVAASTERLPWEIIDAVLRRASEGPTLCFTIIFPFLKLEKLRELCKEVHSNPSCPQGRKIVTYGLLYNLLYEYTSYPIHGTPNHTWHQYMIIARQNLGKAIMEINLLIAPSYENIQALAIASSYSVELCRPSLCWAFTTTAAGLCQSLGYHRQSALKDDDPDERSAKMSIFWHIYVMDKNLSLRLGRPSAIQDWDISIDAPSIGAAHTNNSLGVMPYWINLARLQGQTYEQLFSPTAFKKPETERVKIATRLTCDLNKSLEYRREMVSLFQGNLGDFGELFYRADEVLHYSVMTLVQRGIQPGPDSVSSTFNNECIESAREALKAHQACSDRFNTTGNEESYSGYVHWSILQAPFTPFMVIFCHIIEITSPHGARNSNPQGGFNTDLNPSGFQMSNGIITGNASLDPLPDLSLLSQFVASLESTRCMSQGADRQYRLCSVFLQVAKIYTDARTIEKQAQANAAANPQNLQNAQPGDQAMTGEFGDLSAFDLQGIEQFDPYLSALGMAPNAAWPMAAFPMGMGGENVGGTDAGNGMISGNGNGNGGFAYGSTTQDWFSGSRYIMGLLEDDFNMVE